MWPTKVMGRDKPEFGKSREKLTSVARRKARYAPFGHAYTPEKYTNFGKVPHPSQQAVRTDGQAEMIGTPRVTD